MALLGRGIGRRRRARPLHGRGSRLTAAAFRAVVDERLSNLEGQLDEVKSRVHGLIFLLAGAVAVQLVLRLLA